MFSNIFSGYQVKDLPVELATIVLQQKLFPFQLNSKKLYSPLQFKLYPLVQTLSIVVQTLSIGSNSIHCSSNSIHCSSNSIHCSSNFIHCSSNSIHCSSNSIHINSIHRNSYHCTKLKIYPLQLISKILYHPLGQSPDLVVMGGDSCFKGCGFESQHLIPDGHFSRLIVVKFVMFV